MAENDCVGFIGVAAKAAARHIAGVDMQRMLRLTAHRLHDAAALMIHAADTGSLVFIARS